MAELFASQQNNPTQNYILEHHPGNSIIITNSGRGGGANNNSNTAVKNENENIKQSKVIKGISSMNENCNVSGDIYPNAFNAQAPAQAQAQVPAPIHPFYQRGLVAQPPIPFPYAIQNAMTIAVQPEFYQRNMTMVPECEQKAFNEQVYSHRNLPGSQLHHAQTAAIYTDLDGPQYAPNHVPPPSYQLMRELIMSSHRNKSGLNYIDGRVQNINEITAQPNYLYNVCQFPAYNKPFGSPEQMAPNANSSVGDAGHWPAMAERSGNINTIGRTVADDLREKTDAFNNRLQEYAKLKEQLVDNKANSMFFHKSNIDEYQRHANDIPSSGGETRHRNVVGGGNSKVLEVLSNDINSTPTSAHLVVTNLPLLQDIPEGMRDGEQQQKIDIKDEGYRVKKEDQFNQEKRSANNDNPDKPTQTPLPLATSSRRPSITTDMAQFANFSASTEQAKDAALDKSKCGDFETQSTPQSQRKISFAFDLPKSSDTPLPMRKEEQNAYMEDIDDDNRSIDSIESVQKKVETLTLRDAISDSGQMARKASVDNTQLDQALRGSTPNSRKSSIGHSQGIAQDTYGVAATENLYQDEKNILNEKEEDVVLRSGLR